MIATAIYAFLAALIGTIVDATTEAPVSGATVLIPTRGEISITDTDGTFFIDVPSNSYDLIVQAPGYETTRFIDLTIPEEGSDLRLALPPGRTAAPADSGTVQTYQVGETTVTASRTHQRTTETPREVRVLDRRAIADRQPRGTPEALAEIPEVHVQKTNLGGGAPILRGLSGNRVLLIVDGVRMNNSTYRIGLNQYLNTVDPGIVDRIEIVPGAGSVLYGSDALGGVVEVTTIEPSPGLPQLQYRGRVTAAEGSTTNTVQFADWWGSGGFVGGGTYRNLNDLRAGGGLGVQRPTAFSEWSANGRLRLDTGERNGLTLAYQITRQDDVPRTDRIVSGRDSVFAYDPQQRELALARYEMYSPTSGVEYARVTASWNHQREGRTVVGFGADVREEELDDVHTFGLAAEARSLIGRSTLLVYGTEVYADAVDSDRHEIDLATGAATAVAGKFPDDGTQLSFGTFAQAQRVLSRVTTLIGALRFSAFRTKGTPQPEAQGEVTIDNRVVTGALQARFAVGGDDILFAGVSQAFRAPNMEDALSTGLSNKGLDVPNPGLDPERSVSIEAGIKTNGFLDPDDWRRDVRKSYRLNATAYLTLIEDLVERVPATFMGADSINGNAVFRNENLGGARIVGVTANGAVRFHRAWTATAAAAFTHGENTDLDVPLTRIPPFRGSVSVRRELGAGWIEAVGLWATKQDRLSPDDLRDSRIPAGGTPGYVIGSLRSGVALPGGLALRGTFENVADRGYRVHGSGIDASGRNLIVGVEWTASPWR